MENDPNAIRVSEGHMLEVDQYQTAVFDMREDIVRSDRMVSTILHTIIGV